MVADMKRTGSFEDNSEEETSPPKSSPRSRAAVKFKVKKIQIDTVTDGTNTKEQSIRELQITSETGSMLPEEDEDSVGKV